MAKTAAATEASMPQKNRTRPVRRVSYVGSLGRP